MANILARLRPNRRQPVSDNAKGDNEVNIFVIVDAVLICIACYLIYMTYSEMSQAPYRHADELARVAVVMADPKAERPKDLSPLAVSTWLDDMKRRIENGIDGAQVGFYSQNPAFSDLSNSDGIFAKTAWNAIAENGESFFTATGHSDRVDAYRVAVPLRYSAICENCSPVTKNNGVLGLQIINVPISNDALKSLNRLLLTIAMLAGALMCVLGIFIPLLNRQKEENAEIASIAKNLEEQASTDPLTGLKNRRYFEQALKAYFLEFGRCKRAFGLLTIDLDHFKQVNDSHGHDVGDLVLKELAELLENISREHDIVARLGGEEFAVITPYAEEGQLIGIAERYRRAIGQMRVNTGNVVVCPTASIGVCSNDEVSNTSEMYKRSDERLYEAKRNGRNRVAA